MTEKLIGILIALSIVTIGLLYAAWRLQPRSNTYNTLRSEMKRDILVCKIASFFEQEENWRALMDCWLDADGHSEGLRGMLRSALADVDFDNI